MKSSFFTVLFAGLLAASSSSASPATSSDLHARTGSSGCGRNQFFYKQRNCCLDNGGPRDPPQPPNRRDCPGGWYWNPGQGCCTPRTPPRDSDPEPQCTKRKFKWKKHTQCCEQDDDDDTPPPPAPSPAPPAPGKKDDKDCDDDDKKKGKGHKRSEGATTKVHAKKALKARSQHLCPFGLEACSTVGSEFECIDTPNDVTSCGGCASTSQGQDCTAIPYALSVGCQAGSCSVHSCESGYQPLGKACIPVLNPLLPLFGYA